MWIGEFQGNKVAIKTFLKRKVSDNTILDMRLESAILRYSIYLYFYSPPPSFSLFFFMLIYLFFFKVSWITPTSFILSALASSRLICVLWVSLWSVEVSLMYPQLFPPLFLLFSSLSSFSSPPLSLFSELLQIVYKV